MIIGPRDFYNHNAEQVAPEMLGKLLVHHVDGIDRIGRIVEVEAYVGPHDLAAHSSKGRTARTEVMFGEPGHAYVYLIYGMYNCLNAVTGPGDHASAVLIRALEPVSGIEGATNGPGRLCRTLSIDRSLNGHDLLGGELYLARPKGRVPRFKVVAGPRVGVDYAGDWIHRPLRFTIEDNPFLSRR
jgi:DNA-3-methyladenine glycosylase